MAQPWKINFGARTLGAIGCGARYTETVTADSDKAAILSLYDRYEHITTPREVLPDGRERLMSWTDTTKRESV